MTGKPTFRKALLFWTKLGFISFGGPSGQIAIMHEELVERRRWIAHDRFLHALNFCMLLPGPEAQQLAIYCGWVLHGWRGGLAGGILFVVPSAILLWLLSWLYVSFGASPLVAAAFAGLKPAVLAIVAVALLKIARKSLKGFQAWAIAAMAFGAIYFAVVPFPFIIAGAAVLGYLGGRGEKGERPPEETSIMAGSSRMSWQWIILICLTLWALPIVASSLLLGREHAVTQQGLFFSKAALVTFGGAYAVLPYVAQQAVENFGWLSGVQMLDGLGLAETTPGPLVIVLEFVGFMGGWNHPGNLAPLVSATLAAAMTVWVTFVPCFLWILLGAPHVERLRRVRWTRTALSGITAAVVGVILNLALWFGEKVIWTDAGIEWFAVAVALAAGGGLVRWKWSVVLVVLASIGAGLIAQALNIV